MAAIYQWYISDLEIEWLTTTLYPLEATEGAQFAVDLDFGSMSPIPNEYMTQVSVPRSGAMTTILLARTQPTELMYQESIPLSGAMITILLSRTQATEEMSQQSVPVSGALVSKLVTIDAPPEGALFSMDLDGPTCSMDAV